MTIDVGEKQTMTSLTKYSISYLYISAKLEVFDLPLLFIYDKCIAAASKVFPRGFSPPNFLTMTDHQFPAAIFKIPKCAQIVFRDPVYPSAAAISVL
jgi:hypothetical protein